MADQSQFVVVAPYALRDWGGRPRRYLDPAPLPFRARALVGAWFDNDEQLERDYHRSQRGTVRRIADAFLLIAQNYATLRRARMIYCLDGMHYAILLALSRARLFNADGKIIRRPAFHDTAWQRLAPRLRGASPAFQVECITHEQFVSASQALGAHRVVSRPWKIDTGWFQPAYDVPKTRALMPGNISRDESIVPLLLHQGISITRVARLAHLEQHYALEIADPRFELITNASHREYLELLLAAPAVLLPIVPCDGSAGLTAAMEAIAAGVPVIANRTMGLAELFAECEYPVPMLNNLDPEAWAQAYRQIEAEHDSPDFLLALENSRHLLVKHHRILPMGDDWSNIFAAACAAESAACEHAMGEASPAT
ncbi:hypothetical protein [Prosthecobacter sp.]|uniref:glycosyltransferase n=1 Tax=Prosthecobacter sp. TaxID=1965333 RepID=UPI001D5E65CC|nr:hypothetical protein [Prosthecobacter sp.]MCB1278116.1 hypothetical protein [Prosthecobacter sp.]